MSLVLAGWIAVALFQSGSTPLDMATQNAEVFWDQFTSVQCVEKVTQLRLQKNGKVTNRKVSEFDYVSLLRPKANGIAVEESRVPRNAVPKDKETSFLLTSGFPALLLMFHPTMRGEFDFVESPAAPTPSDLVRLAFELKPNVQSMSAVRLKGRTYPIRWRGVAWIDRNTGNVRRIEAELASSMEDLGITELSAVVEYDAVSLKDSTDSHYQLPARATITVTTLKQQWRNVHEFSDYRLFTVTTSTHGEPAKGER